MMDITVATLNCRGQTRLTVQKQLAIQDFIKSYNIDVIFLQETNFNKETFFSCSFVKNNFSFVFNNAVNEYGTACLIKNSMCVSNVNFDSAGRVITFDCDNITMCNVYPMSGTDGVSRHDREHLISAVIPNILINKKVCGIVGGDWNCISVKTNCSRNPEGKLSPSLQRLISLMNLKDSHRCLSKVQTFSRYYLTNKSGQGATRIDRLYHYGEVIPTSSCYVATSFSDHLAQVVSYCVPLCTQTTACPKAKPVFKISNNVIDDNIFRKQLKESMSHWRHLLVTFKYPVLDWWELLVKPGIRKLAITRSKEINKSRRGRLDFLNILLINEVGKLKCGVPGALFEVRKVQKLIEEWFREEAEKIKVKAGIEDITESESVQIFQHEIHKKVAKKSAILELHTESGVKSSHKECA